ncbi:MAG TPA: hypothetical protein VGP14_06470 [Casimicrobiaceae bacterium]|jgi:hypothetical protein|nr:hypothetical protein [Casimicrobiaceae bacterium]
MSLRQWVVLTAGVLLAVTAAQAQTSVRVRGTITASDGNVLSVKSREARDLKITLADNVTVFVAKAIRFEDIKPGDKLGVTSMPGTDGVPVAVEVHYLPPGVPEGQGPWDLQPGSTMTNASVVTAIVAGTGNRELTLQFQGKTQKVAVPENAALVRAVPGSRSDLAAGEYVFTVAQGADDQSLSAARVQVSKDGIKPPL